MTMTKPACDEICVIPRPRIVRRGTGRACAEAARRVEKIRNPEICDEGYALEIMPDRVRIEASTDAGFFYAEKTLDQLGRSGPGLPIVSVEDGPKHSHRGFMLDCARHYFPLDAIKRKIDAMADAKMNKFHWHLTDDQGWRIEIKKYPKLTEEGSAQGGKRLFYSQAEAREIVEYCEDRFIEVIPEIDGPGHVTAALVAHPELSCRKEKKKLATHMGIYGDILCAGSDATMEFWKDVLTEIAELFPGRFVHLGGDEAPKKRWRKCPACRARIEKLGLKGETELQAWFMTEMGNHLKKLGKTPIFWNDGIGGRNLDCDFAVQYWTPFKGVARTREAQKAGHELICSDMTRLYFDYPPKITPLRRVYGCGAKFDSDGCLGFEAALWTEWVKDEATIDRRIFPRLYAVADRAWSSEVDYASFKARLAAFLRAGKKEQTQTERDPAELRATRPDDDSESEASA